MNETHRTTRMDGTHCRVGLTLCDWVAVSYNADEPRCTKYGGHLKADTRGALCCEACRGVEQRDGRTD
jgi:hypothetical protein